MYHDHKLFLAMIYFCCRYCTHPWKHRHEMNVLGSWTCLVTTTICKIWTNVNYVAVCILLVCVKIKNYCWKIGGANLHVLLQMNEESACNFWFRNVFQTRTKIASWTDLQKLPMTLNKFGNIQMLRVYLEYLTTFVLFFVFGLLNYKLDCIN